MKQTDFDEKLKHYKRITSDKTKHVLFENELNELSKKVKLISTKGLTKALKNSYCILKNGIYLVKKWIRKLFVISTIF